MKLIPILLAIISSVFYHVCQRSTTEEVSPFVTLIVTYVVASILSIILYLLFVPQSNITTLVSSMKQVNWASFVLGLAVVGLELGFLMAYRSGWNISVLGLLTNITVALMLIPIGLLFFKESMSISSLLGVVICMFGLMMISK